MNLFDQLVTEALKNQPNLSSLRIVVEKELLHHDILRTLSQNNLLTDLTFIGGTCLRACYGGIRLSEDLDFTGGKGFSRNSLSTMGRILTHSLNEKYGLQVSVSEPVKDIKNVDTWKIKIETRPQQKNLPAQQINIDICAISSYEKQPMVLLNPYGVDMGTNGLVLQTQSRAEIYTDKLIAFALRPNRLKYRDLWDMVWLHQQGIKPNFSLIPSKLQDRKLTQEYFLNLFTERHELLLQDNHLALEFNKEMRRFLSPDQINKTIAQNNLWSFIVYLIGDLDTQLRKSLVNEHKV
ncbi:MAG TPA: nucleotidyl transferase AbiEii/AbiGii toxin family protein [Gammaproteobacteria bacterium]|nr:nucleotidyl transferase AbiEii/AbiGii toxin family protein [Gammaproteobacteria bacterium]HRA42903.1 nucleotidyl transferase AbiEii/AbiGii toxin family protein [Gammaproteobacteria bacterium]